MKENIIQLHSLLFTDKEIAKKLNKSIDTIKQKRLSYGLKPNKPWFKYKDEILSLMSNNTSNLKIYTIYKQFIGKRYIEEIRKLYGKPYFSYKTYTNAEMRIKGYMIRNSKFSAKRRKLEFNLDIEDIELPEYCPLLNIKLEYNDFTKTTKYNNDNHASLDRIDNSKGYIKGNVWVISRLANAMKNSASIDQLKIFSLNINKYFK